jgi:hypothetical protein
MADVTVSVPPGYYGGAQTVVVTFPANVRKAIITQDDVPPVLSEVLAYDQGPLYSSEPPFTGVPPGDIVDRPFLAVTQDGRGNVVYDAGFPKYYNGTMPVPTPSSFATLTPAMKYMYNALKFIAKPNVPKKILIVGNTRTGENYDVKGSGSTGIPASGFLDTFNVVLPMAGFTFDVKNVTDFPGTNMVDGTLSLFNQYCAVVVLCGHYCTAAEQFITEQFASELASYRANGGGVFIITDHLERIYTSLADATANSVGFGKDANRCAKYYGTYFSGAVDRAPVLVSEIKRQLSLNGGSGNHPLLANLADTESIFAGGSESLVMVETYAAYQVNPANPQSYTFTQPGSHRLNVLVQMNDGTVFVRPFRYDLIDPSNLLLVDTRNRTISQTHQTVKRMFDLAMIYNIGSPPTLTGRVTRNGIPHGTFQLSNNVITLKMCSGNNTTFGFLPTDKIGFLIEVPFLYNVNTTVQALSLTALNASWTQLAGLGKELIALPDYTGLTKKDATLQFWQYANVQYRDEKETGGNAYGIWPRVLTRVGRALEGGAGSCKLWIATNTADWTANKPTNPVQADTVIQADNNKVYTWWVNDGVGAWALSTETASEFFGSGRLVVNTRNTAEVWQIGVGSTVKL